MTETEAVNWPLVDAVLAQIEAHPETWNQEHWRCGTSFCFAGWAVEMSPDASWVEDEGWADDVKLLVHGVVMKYPPGHAAAHLLNLPGDAGDDLFEATNSLDDIKAVIRNIRAGEYETKTCEFCGQDWPAYRGDECPDWDTSHQNFYADQDRYEDDED
ncbi:hypothetical protein [Kineococcus sp. NPDC059986]|uniref:hypothetical protein n=1 Tax=Actinomycetes TaxID=1760 RepID=UPI00344E96E2